MELVHCLLCLVHLVKGNQSNVRQWCISLCAILCIFTGEDKLPPLPLTYHTFGAGVAADEVEGLQEAVRILAGWLAQTCVEPSGLSESCLSRLLYSPLPRIYPLGQGTPSLSWPLRMLHQEKSLLEQVSVQLGDQADPVALETSPTSRGKTANAK